MTRSCGHRWCARARDSFHLCALDADHAAACFCAACGATYVRTPAEVATARAANDNRPEVL